jgi:GR25 family glycosyltransferase involved in LPS biosynthesis
MTDSPPIPAFVVNLDADVARREQITKQIAHIAGVTLQRVPGVPGATLPRLACDILTKTPDYAVGKGTLGVFLAHLSVWECVAASDA